MVRYDIRGHGRSDQPITADAYTSKCMAEDFKAVCEAFSLTRPFLAGWSYDGTIRADICEHLGVGYLGRCTLTRRHRCLGGEWRMQLETRHKSFIPVSQRIMDQHTWSGSISGELKKNE